MKNNENKSICTSCGGKCCKQMPGIVSPKDANEINVDYFINMYENGYQFDYWEGNLTGDPEHADLTFWYLRPQTKNSVGRVVDASWGGECVFLTENGCPMKFKDRPAQCRALKPSPEMECNLDPEYDKKEMIKEWLPYNEIITKAINIISERK
jgi:Fe-S-cluster containining protein